MFIYLLYIFFKFKELNKIITVVLRFRLFFSCPILFKKKSYLNLSSAKKINYTADRSKFVLIAKNDLNGYSHSLLLFLYVLIYAQCIYCNTCTHIFFYYFSDVGTLTLSRHILLDPILLFFIMASIYCLLKFSSYKQE